MVELEQWYKVLSPPLDFYRSLHLPLDTLKFSDFKQDIVYELNNHILDSIEVTQELTPALCRTMQTLIKDLSLIPFDIRFFVYASSELQASCLASTPTSAIITISSALIDLLDENEMKFVIGHELGHLIFQHNGGCRGGASNHRISRIQELSCDRIGLLACKSISDAISTQIKCSSGLPKKHLRIDVSYYIDQVTKIDNNAPNATVISTHPAWLIRARSLVHFQAILPPGSPHGLNLQSLDRVNNQILKEIDKYSDYNLKSFAEAAYANVLFWLIAIEVVNQGKISRPQQTALIERFGVKKVDKFIRMLTDNAIEQAQKICQRNIDQSRQELQDYSIITFESCVKEAKELLAK